MAHEGALLCTALASDESVQGLGAPLATSRDGGWLTCDDVLPVEQQGHHWGIGRELLVGPVPLEVAGRTQEVALCNPRNATRTTHPAGLLVGWLAGHVKCKVHSVKRSIVEIGASSVVLLRLELEMSSGGASAMIGRMPCWAS